MRTYRPIKKFGLHCEVDISEDLQTNQDETDEDETDQDEI